MTSSPFATISSDASAASPFTRNPVSGTLACTRQMTGRPSGQQYHSSLVTAELGKGSDAARKFKGRVVMYVRQYVGQGSACACSEWAFRPIR